MLEQDVLGLASNEIFISSLFYRTSFICCFSYNPLMPKIK
jgi:hypothetical protein